MCELCCYLYATLVPDVKHLTGGSVETPSQSIASSLLRKARDECPSGRHSLSLELHSIWTRRRPHQNCTRLNLLAMAASEPVRLAQPFGAAAMLACSRVFL